MNTEIIPPRHIAIIMDGNGRWASTRSLQKDEGHKNGVITAEAIANVCIKIGVEYLTLYAFSSENWDRPGDEVASLMHLLRNYLLNEAGKLIEGGIRIVFIGDRSKLDSVIQDLMTAAEVASQHNKFCLIIAISYGARDEIRNAALSMCRYVIENQIPLPDIKSSIFDTFMDRGIPDPDLLIRTGGERRISNFLLWQLSYTELYFTEKLWPDFQESDLLEAIKDFSMRERRYGR